MADQEIEVFLAGRASRGITDADLAEVAGFDCAANPIGICFGHPKNDEPAAGTIGGFRADGNKLFAKIASLTTKAVDGIKNNEWINRSMAFFHPEDEANPTPGKWAPRHLGLLGASAPGIPGMTPLKQALAFDADGGLVATDAPLDAVWEGPAGNAVHSITFSKEDTQMAEFTAEQIAENARLAEVAAAQTARETAFAARMKTTFEAGNASIVSALVTAGKVLPAEADALTTVFNAFDPDGEELTFGAGDKATKATAASALATFLDGALGKRVPVGERKSPTAEFQAADKDMTTEEITLRANALVKDKGLTFEAAVEKVQAQIAAAQ